MKENFEESYSFKFTLPHSTYIEKLILLAILNSNKNPNNQWWSGDFSKRSTKGIFEVCNNYNIKVVLAVELYP